MVLRIHKIANRVVIINGSEFYDLRNASSKSNLRGSFIRPMLQIVGEKGYIFSSLLLSIFVLKKGRKKMKKHHQSIIYKIYRASEEISTSYIIMITLLLFAICMNFYVLNKVKEKTYEIEEMVKTINEREPIIIEKEIIKEIHTKKPEIKKSVPKSSPIIKNKSDYASVEKNKISKYIVRCNKSVNMDEAKYMAECFIEAGKKYNINPYLLASIAKVESTYYKNSVSRSGAIGLMQVNWRDRKSVV